MKNINSKNLEKYSIFKVGHVVSVKGRFVQVQVDKKKNLSHLMFEGQLIKNVAVGGYVKIAKGFERIIGKIEGEYITKDLTFNTGDYGSNQEKIKRILEISLLGFYENENFKRGIESLLLVEEAFFLANH